MTVSIVVQRLEEWPWKPGWWRFSRPRHEIRELPPEIREDTRWWYGDAAAAARAAAEWDTYWGAIATRAARSASGQSTQKRVKIK